MGFNDFTVKKINGFVTITSYTGEEREVFFPDKIDGQCIDAIGSEVFKDCPKKHWIHEIHIAGGISHIDDGAFFRLMSLETVHLGFGVHSLGYLAFGYCPRLSLIYLPGTIENIQPDAFEGSPNICFVAAKEVLQRTMGSSPSGWMEKTYDFLFSRPPFEYLLLQGEEHLTAAIIAYTGKEKSAFIPQTLDGFKVSNVYLQNNFLESITLDSSLLKKEDSCCFANCPNLRSVVIEGGGKKAILSRGLFANDTTLLSVSLPNRVIRIEPYAFQKCLSLRHLLLPNDTLSFEASAFDQCRNLTIVFSGQVDSKTRDLLFERGIEILPRGEEGFWGDRSTEVQMEDFVFKPSKKDDTLDLLLYKGHAPKLVLPEEFHGLPVTKILARAFFQNKDLEEVEIPASYASIGKEAFGGCTNLKKVTLPKDALAIEKYAFQDCENLEMIFIPKEVRYLGDWAFWGCEHLTILVENNDGDDSSQWFSEFWDDDRGFAYVLNPVFKEDADFKYVVTDYGEAPEKEKTVIIYAYKGKNPDVRIPEKIDGLCVSDAFIHNDDITSLYVPAEYDGFKMTFSYCRNLKRAELSDKVTDILYGYFWGCKKLQEVVIPDSVTLIEEFSFAGCTSLKEITVKKGTQFEPDAFCWAGDVKIKYRDEKQK